MFSGNTTDTTRVWGEDVFSVMLNAFQMAYPGFPTAKVPWKPNAITMVPGPLSIDWTHGIEKITQHNRTFVRIEWV